MVFPVVASTATSAENTNTSVHTISLPSGIASGDLLITIMTSDTDDAHTWPSDWTELYDSVRETAVRSQARYREADGTEGSNITVATPTTEKSGSISYRITGHNSTAPEISAVSGDDTNPDPPNLAPSWGAADTLWLAFYGQDGSGTVDDFPDNYSSGLTAARHANNQGDV